MGMLDKLLERFSRAGRNIRLNETDVKALQALFRTGKIKQYDLEKNLKGIAHSTVTSKLQRFIRDGLATSLEESDGLRYYEISPLGIATLIYKGKLQFKEAIQHFRERPLPYYETLVKLQPRLKDILKKQSLYFVDQLTDDLWMIYYVRRRADLRREVMEYLLGKRPNASEERLSLALQTICTNIAEIEKNLICLRERKICDFSQNISKCPILKKQMEDELDRLE